MKELKIKTQNLSVYFDYQQALNNISLEIYSHKITSIIGPSGCGKSTFLKTLNRMNEYIPGFRKTGEVYIDGIDIYKRDIDVVNLRKHVGMVFQTSNLFPKSVYDNITFAPKLHGVKKKNDLDEIVEKVCKKAAIWDEVKDRLNDSALNLSAGQQQRLCIARVLSIEPDVILLDEPASALDPASTAKIEELMMELRNDYTVIIITHNMQQAARISDYTAFFYMGQLVEFEKTTKLFTNPTNQQTEDYITGRYG